MSNVTKVTTVLDLNLTDIPDEDIKKAKKEVGDFLINSILREVGNGKSPVEGERFQKLKKDYAKKEHGGRRLPILELEGDMLTALKHEGASNSTPKLEIGINGKEAPKADGHNQLSSEARAWAVKTKRTEYKRRFIPSDKQKFKGSILTGVEEILSGFRVTPIETIEVGTIDSAATTAETTTVSTSDFFADDVIESLLLEELRKQGRI